MSFQSYPPASIVEYKRDRQKHKVHVQKLRSMHSMIDTSVPAGYGMKHLASRAKKKQLVEDRLQEIAQDNRKLMEKMVRIMNKQAVQEKPIHISSLNARERVQYVNKINNENKKMHARLKGITAMISVNKLEEDFQRHRKIGEHLRRPIFGASSHHHKSKRRDGSSSPNPLTSSIGTLPAIGARNPLDEIRDEVIGKKKRAEMAERQQSLSKINPPHKIQNHTISFTHVPESSPSGRETTFLTGEGDGGAASEDRRASTQSLEQTQQEGNDAENKANEQQKPQRQPQLNTERPASADGYWGERGALEAKLNERMAQTTHSPLVS